MNNKFQHKYLIPSARWRGWDYADEGAYFITICTKNREHRFGNVVNGEMVYSELGKIAVQEWLKSAEMRPDMNLDMEIFQIMPNHIHGILVIGNNEYNSRRDAMLGVSNLENHEIDFLNSIDFPNTINCDRKIRDTRHCVSTGNTKMIELNPPANHFGPQSKNLASIVRGFKSAVTVASKLIGPVFGWQTRFHDHVIREDDEFRRIAYYIEQNPANWKDDMYK